MIQTIASIAGRHLWPLIIVAAIGTGFKWLKSDNELLRLQNENLHTEVAQVQKYAEDIKAINHAVAANTNFRDALREDYYDKLQTLQNIEHACLDVPIDFDGLFNFPSTADTSGVSSPANTAGTVGPHTD